MQKINNVDSPFYFPAHLNIEKAEIDFIKLTKQELDKFVFHDNRLNIEKKIVLIRKIFQIEGTFNKRVSFIFHTAFCGSTLLSRLLSQKYISIREPNVFMNLANLLRVNPSFKNDKKLFNNWLTKVLLSFMVHMDSDYNIIFKPTNTCNNIIDALLKNSPNSKALLLYTDLDSFLISILKKGEAGKAFIRNLYNILSLDGSPYAITDFRKVNCFTDLQITCLVWSMQIHAYRNIANSTEISRFKLLNASEFLDNPKRMVSNIATFFGENFDDTDISDLENSGFFSSHSKFNKKQYNAEIRQQENNTTRIKYAKEIDEVNNWMDKSFKPPSIPSQKFHFDLEY